MSVEDGEDVTVAALSLGGLMGRGGQGEVHAIDGGDLAFKRYRYPSKIDQAALAALPAFRQRLHPSDRSFLDAVAAWPLCRVTHGGHGVGLLMRRSPARMSWRTPTGETRLLELQYLLRPPRAGFRTVPQPTPRERRALALAFVEAIDWFHGAGIVLGDISHANVLWALDPEPGVYFLDCDGFRLVGGPPVQPQTDTPDWDDPRTPAFGACRDSDAYKTALAVARIVAQDPYVMPGQELRPVAGCLDERQEAAVVGLFAEAAGERGTRPAARAWYLALALNGGDTAAPDAGRPALGPPGPRPVPDGFRDRKPINLRVSGR
ncbi:hypothetical protein [Streptomyces sp. NPDC054787]